MYLTQSIKEINGTISPIVGLLPGISTMTKKLTIGYRRAESAMKKMKNFRPTWNVNAFAQAAGSAALHSERYVLETLAKLRNEKDALILGLRKLGYEPVPSTTNYFLLSVGSGAQFREKLLRQVILVRDCASFGLPSYVRIATRTRKENTRLLKTLQRLLQGVE